MKSRKNNKPIPSVWVISDSTGNLPRHLLAALLTQFPAHSMVPRFESYIRDEKRLAEVLDQAREQASAVCHAMVSPQLKEQITDFCKKNKLPCCDLTGGIVEFLGRSTGIAPCQDVSALHRLDGAYHRRIGAMEFTLSHDDGLGLETLSDADVVLVGVSRTSKTPTSILLAQQGYRTANVSLAKGVEPPAQLLSIPKEKVVGMIINPTQLSMIRNRRQNAWGMAPTSYGDPVACSAEVAWSRSFFHKHGWAILDVTDQAVEETAARIAEMLGLLTQSAEHFDGEHGL
jgi:regulator of PEP synthase PpsR (kinase-PPPase family)